MIMEAIVEVVVVEVVWLNDASEERRSSMIANKQTKIRKNNLSAEKVIDRLNNNNNSKTRQEFAVSKWAKLKVKKKFKIQPQLQQQLSSSRQTLLYSKKKIKVKSCLSKSKVYANVAVDFVHRNLLLLLLLLRHTTKKWWAGIFGCCCSCSCFWNKFAKFWSFDGSLAVVICL